MSTRQQQWATRAYEAVKRVSGSSIEADYARICKTFPALLHGSGLCQAVGFAQAKGKNAGGKTAFGSYLRDLAAVLELGDENELADKSRRSDALPYLRLSQESLAAASWLKRYAEALLKDSATECSERP